MKMLFKELEGVNVKVQTEKECSRLLLCYGLCNRRLESEDRRV